MSAVRIETDQGVMVATEQAQQRSDVGLGASEVSAALNLNPYRSAYELWEEKIGERAPFAGNDNTRWGQLIEPAARAAYVEKTGYALLVPPTSMYAAAPEWARATPDAIAIDPDHGRAWLHLVQIKNTGYWPGQQWKHGPPEHVVIQEQWELFVTGLQRADVVVCLAGGFPDFFTVQRDQALIDDLVLAARKFWRHVETRTPPPIDDSGACRSYWTRRGSDAVVEGVLVPWDLGQAVAEQYREAWTAARVAKKQLEIAKNTVIALCAQAEAEGIEAYDGTIQWQRRKARARTDWEAIARLVASASGMSAKDFEHLMIANTKAGKEGRAVIVPKSWGTEDE